MKCKLYLKFEDLTNLDFLVDNNYGYNYESELNKLQDLKFQPDYERINTETETRLTTCECEVFDTNYEPASIDTLVTYAVNGGNVDIIVRFDFDSIEEEFEEELRLWARESSQIYSRGWVSNNGTVREYGPKEHLMLSFKNLKNIDTFLILNDCVITGITREGDYKISVGSICFGRF